MKTVKKEEKTIPFFFVAGGPPFVLLLILLVFAACDRGSGRSDGENTGRHSQLEQVDSTDEYGYQHRFFYDTAGLRAGLYEKYTPGGARIEEAFYQDDLLDGARIIYYESGDTQVVERYRLGQFEGEYRYYYENGNLQLVGQYIGGEMNGEWRKYYETGELMEIVTFQHNEENGPFIEYYPNGKLKAEGAYLEGDHEHGELKLYDEEGRLVRKMQCEKGICRTTWSAEEAKG